MTERNPLIPDRIGPYYVYLLVDPRSGRPFYVGKGTGERFWSHGDAAGQPIEASLLAADADATPTERENRLARIREIRGDRLEPETVFARIGIKTGDEAYLVEAALIDALDRYVGTLVNEVRGHRTPDGLITLEDLEREVTTDVFTTQTPAILIKLFDWVSEVDPDTGRSGGGFRSDMKPAEVLESVRAWWVLDPKRATNYQYVVAVHDGITRGVWEVVPGSWQSWTPRPDRRLRWSFTGREAPPEIHEMFVGRIGRRVPASRANGKAVFGQGSPIAYWPR
jgi:hypothetical protein